MRVVHFTLVISWVLWGDLESRLHSHFTHDETVAERQTVSVYSYPWYEAGIASDYLQLYLSDMHSLLKLLLPWPSLKHSPQQESRHCREKKGRECWHNEVLRNGALLPRMLFRSPLHSSPQEQKLVLHVNGFNYCTEIWADRKVTGRRWRSDSLLSSGWINLEFSNLWLVYLLVLILEVRVNRVLLWIWGINTGLISLYLFAYLLISPIHNCVVLTFKTPPVFSFSAWLNRGWYWVSFRAVWC